MFRRLISAVLAATMAVQPAAFAQEAFYYRHGTVVAPTSVTPPTQNPNDEPVRGTGDLAIYLPVQIRARHNVPFSLQVTAANAEGHVTWRNVGSALPPGLQLDAQTGTISGVPTQIGSASSVRFAGTDNAGKEGQSPSLRIDVQPQPTVTVPATLTARTGIEFSVSPSATPIYGSQSWTLLGTLPLGLSLNPATGAIGGTPRQQGTYANLRVSVTDADGARGTSAPFTIVVDSNIAISSLPSTVPARVNKAMLEVRPFASGTSGPYAWSVSSEGAALPPGLSVNPTTGAISGTPSVLGTTNGVALQVVDQRSGTSTISAPFAVTVAAQPSISIPPSLSFRQPNTVSVTPVGNNVLGGGYWTVSPRLAQYGFDASTGVISGPAGAAGTHSGVTFTVIDLFDGATATSSPTTINVWQRLTLAGSPTSKIRVNAPTSLAAPVVSGLMGTPTWSIAGSLPAGLEVNPATGVISGTPTTVGETTLHRRVSDSADGASATSETFRIEVLPPETPIELEIAGVQESLPANVGRFFNFTPLVNGANGMLTWALTGSLPNGLAFDSATGAIAGIPTAPGTTSGLSLSVSNSGDSRTATSPAFSIAVSPATAPTMTMAGPVRGTVGEAMASSTPTLSGIGGGAVFSLNSGRLPEGVELSSTGAFIGTPEVAGDLDGVSILVVDNAGNSAVSNVFGFSIAASGTSPSVSIASRTATIGVAFSHAPNASNAHAPLTWSLDSGTLPSWATLNPSTGAITGTPDAVGTGAPIALKVTDRFARSARSAPFTISVVSAPVLSASIAPSLNGFVGSYFSAVPYSSGANGARTWSLVSGILPDGLSLNAATGAITGIPTANANVANLVLSVRDAASAVAETNAFSISVAASPISIDSHALGSATYNVAYVSAAPSARGVNGTPTWSLATGTLPGWATLDAATGVLSGTPNALGSFADIRLRVTDGAGTSAQTNALSLTVNRTPLSASVAEEIAYPANVAFSTPAPTVSGLAGTPEWTLTSGVLPGGLTLDPATGVISGNLSAPASIPNLALTLRDGFDGTTATTARFTISVLAAPAISVTNEYRGGRNAAFVAAPAVSNAIGQQSWSLASGTLPAWATLSATSGRITGTPDSIQSVPGISLTMTDSRGSVATSSVFSIEITSGLYATLPRTSYSPRVNVPFSSGAPTVANQSGTITWTLASGTLPGWATLNGSTGAITGTPDAPESFTVSLRLSDSAGGEATTSNISFQVSPPATIAVSDRSVRVGAPLTFQPVAQGTVTRATWSVASGTLPDWAQLDSDDGVISGTPTAVGAHPISLRVSEADGSVSTSSPFTITVTPGLSIAGLASSYGGRIDQPFSMTPPTVQNGIGALTWSRITPLAGDPPSIVGLSVNSSTGALVGTPRETKSLSYPIRVRDAADNATASATLMVEIAPELRLGALGTIRVHSEGTYATPAPSVTGRRGTLTFSVSEGTLPAWATLDHSTGVISGTAPAAGANSGLLRIVAQDSADNVVSTPASVTIEVIGALGVANLPTRFSARNGSLFTSARPTAVNALGAATWAWGSGSNPPTWISLDPVTGILSGTPSTVSETSGLSLIVTDSTGKTASSAPFTLAVFSQPSVTISQVSPKGRVGSAISIAPNVSGLSGTPSWALVLQPGSDGLPPGLSLNDSTGAITGTPTAPGQAFFTIRVTDGDDLAIADSPVVSLVVGPTLSLGGMASSYYGRVGSFVSLDLPTLQGQVGSSVSYGLSVQSGSVPAGLSVADTATGHVRGVPTGSLMPTVATLTATDSFDLKQASTSFTLGIRPVPSISGVTDVNLRNDTAVAANALPVSANNLFFPAAAYWSIAGQLPNGVTLNPNTGRLEGMPTGYTTSTTFPNLTLTLTDQTDNRTATSAPFTVTVNAGIDLSTSQPSFTARGGASFVAAAPSVSGLGGTPSWTISTVSGTPRTHTIAANGAVTINAPSNATGTWVYNLIVTDSADGRTASTQVTATFLRATSVSYATNTAVAPDQAVSLTPSVSYNLGALHFELASGSLPAGINLNASTGAITGSTSVVGSSTFVVRAIDTDGYVANSASLRIAVSNAPDVYLGEIPVPKVLKNFTLTPSTNVGTVDWTLTGTLPSGLSFSTSNGSISGQPTVQGTFGPYTINARNTATSITGNSESFSLVVLPGNQISVASAAAKWRVGLAAQTTFTVANAVGAQSWTTTSGGFPAGVTMDPATGRISGNPTQFGNFTVALQSIDSEGAIALSSHTLSVENGPTLSYTSPLMRPGIAASVSPRVQYLLGTPSYTLVSGTLPTGLALNAATGVISGTPQTATPSPAMVTVRVTDSDGAAANATVSLLVSTNDFVVDAGGTNFAATVGEPFSLTANAYVQNQVANQYVSWAIQGSLPPGLSFDPILGTISGTPTALAIGTRTFSLTANYGQQSASSPSLNLVVADKAELVVTAAQTQLTAAMGNPMSVQHSVANATGSVLWTLDSGRLPPGTSLSDQTGLVSGTVTTNGSYAFVLRATNGGKTALGPSVTVTVQDAMTLSVTEVSSNHRVGKIYLANANVSGASGAVTWSLLQGPLPPGVALESSTGRITGTTTASGSWIVRLKATDANGAFKEISHSISVIPGPSVSTVPFQASTVGKAFSYTPTATSTVGATSWSVSGTLPAGLSLTNASTGTISGTPTSATTANGLRLTVVDSEGLTATSAAFSITVSPDTGSLAITVSPNIALQQGEPNSIVPSVTGATGATQSYSIQNLYGGSWSAGTSRLPAGMSFNASTGAISGTPTTDSVAYTTFRITVVDNRTPTAVSVTSNQFMLSIVAKPALEASVASSSQLEQGKPFTLQTTVANAVGSVSYLLQFYTGNGWGNCSGNCAGSLAPGLTYSPSTGVISGTPTSTNVNYGSWRMRVTDSRGSVTSNQFTFAISPWKLPSVAIPETFALKRGEPVTITPTVTDTIGSISYLLQFYTGNGWGNCSGNCAGSLSPGLTYSPSTGVISGTPTSTTVNYGAWRIVITETRDGQPLSATSNQLVMSLTDWVSPTLSMDSTLSFKRGETSSYSASLQGVSGTRSAYSLFYNTGSGWGSCSGNCASGLPNGLLFDTTNGRIYGAPLVTSVPFPTYRIQVTETRGTTPLLAQSNAFTISIADWALPTISYPDRSTYVTGQPFTLTPTIENVSGTVDHVMYYRSGSSWTACPSTGTCAGILPTGLTFTRSTGVVSGTPTGSQTGGFQVRSTETRSGQPNSFSSKSFTISMEPAPGPTLSYGTANTIVGAVNSGFDVLPTPSAGITVTGAYTINYGNVPWTSATGDWATNSLPTGVSFETATGRLSATSLPPSTRGSWRGYRICAPTTAGTACAPEITFSITDRPLVEIEMQTYIDVVQRRSVSVTPTVRNAVGAVTFSIQQTLSQTFVSGSGVTEYASTALPTGMALDPATGTISGTPTGNAGVYRGYKVYAQDSQGTTYRAISPEVVIRVLPMDAMTVTAPEIVDIDLGGVVDFTATISGAFGTPTFQANIGTRIAGVNESGSYSTTSLPTGLTYQSGRVFGTIAPNTAVGDWRGYRICANDQASRSACSGEIIFRIKALPALDISTPEVVYVGLGQTLNLVPVVNNTVGTLTWASSIQTGASGTQNASGEFTAAALPTGLGYSATDGSIAGTVALNTATGRYRGYRVYARDSRSSNWVYSKEIIIEVLASPALRVSAPMMVDVDRGGTVEIVPAMENVVGTLQWGPSFQSGAASVMNGQNGDFVANLPNWLAYYTADGSIRGTVPITATPGRYRGYKVYARDSRSTSWVYSDEIIINVR